MLIPQGMAYAMLAGLPPIMGLYASLVPLLIYPLFGTSRQLSVGPVAMDSLLVIAGVSLLATQGSDSYITLAVVLALMVGLIQFMMGIFRLGFLVNFLSQPLINGFTSAAAIIIGLSQVKYLLGIEIEGSQQVHIVLTNIFKQLANVHGLTLVLGLFCIGVLYSLKKLFPRFPAALFVVILSTVVVWVFNLHGSGIMIVGDVPEGLPGLSIPELNYDLMMQMVPMAFVIALISYMEAIAVAKKFAAKEGYRVSANQELVALGLCNTSAGMFGGYPIAGSFSRTAVNAHAGTHTPMSSVFNALVIGLTLMVLTPLFYYMPKAVLAAIVIVAVIDLVDIKEPRYLFRLRKQDFLILILAFFVTLILGARLGILLTAAASIVLIIRRISYPNVALLGRIPGTEIFRNIRKDNQLEQVDGLVIFRIDASLYYANASYLKDKVQASLAERKGEIKAFLFYASSINEVDATAMHTLFEIVDELESQKIPLYFSDVKGPVREMFLKSGFYERLGRERFFINKEYFIEQFEKNATSIENHLQDHYFR